MDPTPEKLSIVVEGVGEIVADRYATELLIQYEKALKAKKTLEVIFTDESKYWNHPNTSVDVLKKRRAFIKHIRSWATYLDKSTNTGRSKYQRLTTDVVLIATPDDTHVSLALSWLRRIGSCKQIYIEKPLDCSLRSARTLEYYAKFSDVSVYPIDHYLARALPLANAATILGLLDKIGGKLTRVDYYLLENHAKAHTGPIEARGRTETLKHGVILDLFPHVLAIVNLFGKIETIEVEDIKIAQYTFDTEDGCVMETAIPKETFAQIKFSMKALEKKGGNFSVNSVIGKGISGSEKFPELIGSNLKTIELSGTNKNRIVIDLGVKGTVEVRNNKNKSIDFGPNLIEDPYEAIVSKIVNNGLWERNERLPFVISLKDAKTPWLAFMT